MEKQMIGVDIGGTTIKFSVIDIHGKSGKKWHINTDISHRGRNIPQDIIASIRQNVDTKSSDLIGIGVDVPGSIADDGRDVIRAVNLGWHNLPLKDRIEQALNKPVILMNDANAAALGEMWCGAARGKQNLIFVILGTGVGGGLIVDGKVINGVHAAGGEIGHIPVESTQKRRCGCGNINCLETYASASGIVKTMQDILRQHNEVRNNFGGKEIFDWLAAGDQFAKQALDITVHYLGQAVAGMMNTIDAEGVVIGGGLSGAGEALLKPLRVEIDKHIFPQIRESHYFVKKAALGNSAGAYGAVYPLLSLTPRMNANQKVAADNLFLKETRTASQMLKQ